MSAARRSAPDNLPTFCPETRCSTLVDVTFYNLPATEEAVLRLLEADLHSCFPTSSSEKIVFKFGECATQCARGQAFVRDLFFEHDLTHSAQGTFGDVHGERNNVSDAAF